MKVSLNTNTYKHVRKVVNKTEVDQDHLSHEEPWLTMPNDGSGSMNLKLLHVELTK